MHTTSDPSTIGRMLAFFPRVGDDGVEAGGRFAVDRGRLVEPGNLRDDFIEPVAIVLDHCKRNDWSASLARSVITDDYALATERPLAAQPECEARVAPCEHSVIAPQFVAPVTDSRVVEPFTSDDALHIVEKIGLVELDVGHPMQGG